MHKPRATPPAQLAATELLRGVEWRLDEAIQAFAIHRRLNDRCGEEASQELGAIVDRTAGFWQAINLGLQTTLILCIAAVLDKRTNCATFYSVVKALTPLQRNSLPPSIEESLAEIRERYIVFRHKLFAHNDMQRDDVVIDMQNAGFTWDSVADDVRYLSQTHKFLRHVCVDVQPPDWNQLGAHLHLRDLAAVRAHQHTDAVLDLLLAGKRYADDGRQ